MMLQLAQLLLFIIVVCKFHYVCFHVTFPLKVTNIVSLILTSDNSTMETGLGILFLNCLNEPECSCCSCYHQSSGLTLRRLMSYIYIYIYIYGAPILDVSRSHTTTQHSR